MNRRPADLDARLVAWLEEGPTAGPEEVLSKAFARARSTRQDRVGLHRLTQPTRSYAMNTMLKVAAVAAFALAVGVTVLPRGPDIASAPAPSASPSPSAIPPPMPLHQGTLAAGTYTVAPFAGEEWAPCGPAEDPCPEAARDDYLRFTFMVPDGWAGEPFGSGIWLAAEHNSGPAGAGFLIGRGGWMYSDPCVGEDPDVPVGSTVDDFVTALVTHPALDVSEPVDVMLGGYAGKYLDLHAPADLSGCQYFQAWSPTFYAQGPSNQWHIWVIDVEGVRVVIHGSDYPGTAPERAAELAAIVDSFRIETVPPPAASETPMAEEVQATDEIASVAGEAGVPTVGTVPAGSTSGVIDTPIGLARWVHMSGDSSTLPAASPTRSGARFSAVEGNRLEGRRLWTSEDGMRWTSEPIAAPTGAEAGTWRDWSGDSEWWYEPGPGAGRLVRSTDGISLTEVDLSALIPDGPPSIEWELAWASGATAGTIAAVDVFVWAREPFATLGWTEGRTWDINEVEPGVFDIPPMDRSPERRLRFEPVGDGLRVTDVNDGSEVTMLEGTTLTDVRGWARNGGPYSSRPGSPRRGSTLASRPSGAPRGPASRGSHLDGTCRGWHRRAPPRRPERPYHRVATRPDRCLDRARSVGHRRRSAWRHVHHHR